MEKARKRLSNKSNKKPSGYWMNESNVLAALRKIMEENGMQSIPSQRWLNDNNYRFLSTAIGVHHGGFKALRARLGEQPLRKDTLERSDLAAALKEAKKAKRKKGWKPLPGDATLREYGYGSLGAAIQHYRGRYAKFKEVLQQRLGNNSQSLEQLLEEYVSDAV